MSGNPGGEWAGLCSLAHPIAGAISQALSALGWEAGSESQGQGSEEKR